MGPSLASRPVYRRVSGKGQHLRHMTTTGNINIFVTATAGVWTEIVVHFIMKTSVQFVNAITEIKAKSTSGDEGANRVHMYSSL